LRDDVVVGRWICPACDREFALANQSHVCVPGCTVDESFVGRPPVQRAIYDALITHLRTIGPVHEDAVKVGVFLKHERKLAEVRPMAKSLSLALFLPRKVDHSRISRYIRTSDDRIVHVVKLAATDDVDDEVKAWLTEAYDLAGG
jgi:hypothetical protein